MEICIGFEAHAGNVGHRDVALRDRCVIGETAERPEYIAE
jgi:hypothetical protein